jgi:hypothetical protein
MVKRLVPLVHRHICGKDARLCMCRAIRSCECLGKRHQATTLAKHRDTVGGQRRDIRE